MRKILLKQCGNLVFLKRHYVHASFLIKLTWSLAVYIRGFSWSFTVTCGLSWSFVVTCVHFRTCEIAFLDSFQLEGNRNVSTEKAREQLLTSRCYQDAFASTLRQTCCKLIVTTCYLQTRRKLFQHVVASKCANDKL